MSDIEKVDITLFFSQVSRKTAKMYPDFEADTVRPSVKISHPSTQSGHCTLPLSASAHILQSFEQQHLITLDVSPFRLMQQAKIILWQKFLKDYMDNSSMCLPTSYTIYFGTWCTLVRERGINGEVQYECGPVFHMPAS